MINGWSLFSKQFEKYIYSSIPERFSLRLLWYLMGMSKIGLIARDRYKGSFYTKYARQYFLLVNACERSAETAAKFQLLGSKSFDWGLIKKSVCK